MSGGSPPFDLRRREFEQLRQLIYAKTGIHLTDRKRPLVVSRLSRRLRALGMEGFDTYYRYVAEQDAGGGELREMINAITTNKTSFFREPHHFAFLRERVVPEIMAAARRGRPRRLRIWSAGCSSGQEPYSIAATLRNQIGLEDWDVRILATDIDTNVLAEAEAGEYPLSAHDEVPEGLRRRFFPCKDGKVMAAGVLRDMVAFR
jgi:chemotaxis protein methyltransferase CheR